MNALVCILTLLAVSSANAEATTAATNPVRRVVTLLQSLSKQCEKDGKREEDLYENFECWGKSTIEDKTALNAKAEGRITTLRAYVADLASNEIDLKNERKDLTTDLATLDADIETVEDNRAKENQQFEDAKAEMILATDALTEAMNTLRVATAPKPKIETSTEDQVGGPDVVNPTVGGLNLVSLHQHLQLGGMAALETKQANLRKAVEFGHRFLKKGDALFLQRLLLGDVPDVDWKKLNRKADFKMAYKKRSTGIQDTLAKMKNTFDNNIADAIKAENKANTSYGKLHTAKTGQRDTTAQALTDLDADGGAKDLAMKEGNREIGSLTQQVDTDKKFIEETEKALTDKKTEFKERVTLRANEIAAFSKAISILDSDDARDQMKKSFSSQGHFFLQTSQTTHKAKGAAARAAEALRNAAIGSGNSRLASLANELQEPEPKEYDNAESRAFNFQPIINSMDQMIVILNEDEEKDQGFKETCERERMDDTRSAIKNGRTIDDKTATAERLTQEVALLNKEIADANESIEKANEQIASARKLREAETAEYNAADADDRKAIEFVNSAKQVLETYYSDPNNGGSLIQKNKQLPPGAPETFGTGGYKVKGAEGEGIIGMLDMVNADMEKDRTAAATEEGKSQTAFDDLEKDTGDQVRELNSLVNAKTITMNADVESANTARGEAALEEGMLAGTLTAIERVNPDCEYYTVNYPLRRDNRHLELDGLQTAKAMLKGGDFGGKPKTLLQKRSE